MPPKRRLPLLQSPGSLVDEPSDRPPWQWIGFGALFLFVLWIPLAAAAASTAALLSRAPAGWSSESTIGAGSVADDALGRAAVVHATCAGLALAAAAFGAGYLLGRWGGPHVGAREAAAAGLLAAIAAVSLSWATLGPSPAWWVVGASATSFSALGARLGRPRTAPGAR